MSGNEGYMLDTVLRGGEGWWGNGGVAVTGEGYHESHAFKVLRRELAFTKDGHYESLMFGTG